MPEFDFYIDGSALVATLLRVLLILFISWFAHLVVTRATRKAVEFRIPRLQEETQQQLSARAETVSGALNQAAGAPGGGRHAPHPRALVPQGLPVTGDAAGEGAAADDPLGSARLPRRAHRAGVSRAAN